MQIPNLPDNLPKDQQEYISLMIKFGVMESTLSTLTTSIGEINRKMDKQDSLKPKDLEEFKRYIKETILGVQDSLQKQINDKGKHSDIIQLQKDLNEKADVKDFQNLTAILKWLLLIATALLTTMGGYILNSIFGA